MHPLYTQVNSLDKRSWEKFQIPEILMMEHAAIALKNAIISKTPKGERVFIICGPGNNGADGLACARLLMDEYEIMVYLPLGAKSPLAKKQLAMLESLHVKIVNKFHKAHTIVDALFGSGTRSLDGFLSELIKEVNSTKSVKIACDLPTGLGQSGVVFCSDITVTMGALKVALFEESQSEYVGEIIVGDLGIPRKIYETPSSTYLLEKLDMQLPMRNKSQVHKGDFGHLLVLGGQKKGASLLASEAAFGFGVGLVSLWAEGFVPPHIMQTDKVPANTTAIVAGMGMGEYWNESELREILCESPYPLVLDADLCGMDIIKECIELDKPIVLTPHPKEFAKLLFTCKGKKISTDEVQSNRIELAREFTANNNTVLVLKGSHTVISQNGKVYLSPYSAPALAKGGSGDVLAGMIGALIAQGYEPKSAAITSVLAHVLAAKNIECNSYALTPQALIEGVKCL